jgi:ABC-type multidrug transport system fused ATPase/permease subunit
MKRTDAVCPQCNSSKEVYKVSEIYLSGLESIKSSKVLKDNAFDIVFGHPSQKLGRRFVDQTTKRTLVSKFAPPSSSKQRITRSLSPDFIMFATLLLSLFMLYQIFTQQREVFLPALLIILAVAASYVLLRKKIIAKFQQKQNNEAKETDQVKEAIERWMKLYYCAEDFVIFDQKHHVTVPLQDMNLYIFSPEEYIPQKQSED